MSDTPWTPGPWTQNKRWHAHIDSPQGTPLATVNFAVQGFHDTAEHNARLIAAAPEMADLLTRLAAAPSWTDRHEANALMARIRGEATDQPSRS